MVMFHQLSPRWGWLGNGCAEHVAGPRFVKKFVLRMPRRFVKICKAKCDRFGLGRGFLALGHSHWTSGEMGCSRQRLPIFLPLAIFLFDMLATVGVLSQEANSASLSRHSDLILLPGSLF